MEDLEGEIWRDVVGYEGLYQVSNMGRVKSLKRLDSMSRHVSEKILSANGLSAGYRHITLARNGDRDKRKIHWLVCEAFLGKRPSGLQCNHKNGKRTDNRLENLEYCTQSENMMHAYRILGKSHDPNNIPRGEKHKRAKLTESDVLDIRRICNTGNYSQKKLGEKYGVHPSLIYRINKNLIWRHLL